MTYRPHEYKRVRAWARCTDVLGHVREYGETFVDRIYTDEDSELSPVLEIIGDATEAEIAAIEARSKPLEQIPSHLMPPDGPKTGTYQHEHATGAWWTGSHDAEQRRAHRARHHAQHKAQEKASRDEEITALSQIKMPQHGSVDPRSL